MAKTKTLLFSLFLCAGCVLLQAQDTLQRRWSVAAGFHYGFIAAHRPLIVPLQQDHLTGFEASLIFQHGDSRQWKSDYAYPQTGLSLAGWNLGNKEQLGYAVTLIPFIHFPLNRNIRHRFGVKFGWGIGYIDKIFDPDKNYKNVAIGSHFNFSLTLQPMYTCRVSDRLLFGIGPSVTHFSNGSMVTPNLGINLLTMRGQIAYKFGENVVVKPKSLIPYQKRNVISAFGSVSLKQVYPAKGKNYFAATLSGNYSFHRTRKSAYGFGADIFYDNSIHLKLKERNMVLNNDLETLKAGLHAGYELKMADFAIILNMGGYLYTRLKNDGLFYHRFGLKYIFNDHFFVCMNLKSHWGKADYVEWGLGYRLEKLKSK